MFDASPTSREGVVMKIWAQLRQYFFIGWEQYQEKVIAGKLTTARAWYLFTCDYGKEECLFWLEDCKLRVPYKPFGVL
jgi:hypothetical protein